MSINVRHIDKPNVLNSTIFLWDFNHPQPWELLASGCPHYPSQLSWWKLLGWLEFDYCLVVWNMAFVSHMLRMSSYQLTFIFSRGVGQPPTNLESMVRIFFAPTYGWGALLCSRGQWWVLFPTNAKPGDVWGRFMGGKKHSLKLKQYTSAKFWSIIIYNRLSVCCFFLMWENIYWPKKNEFLSFVAKVSRVMRFLPPSDVCCFKNTRSTSSIYSPT